ncbi:MAG TPA: thiol reductant ABC exporter subunit CydC, partial [Candidatus Binatia bacterium]|nr:thiol reductant ABC exporter subunit CydC [Candidatus Binatia bacterium]
RPSIAALGTSIVAVRFFGLARGFCRYLERLTSHRITFHLLAQLRTWTFSALEPLAPARLQKVGSGDLLARTVSDVSALEHFYVRAVSPPLVAITTAIAATGFMLWFHWSLALILIAFFALGGAVLPLAARLASHRLSQKYVSSRAALEALLVQGLQGSGELTVFGRLASFARRIDILIGDLAAAQRRLYAVVALQEALSTLLTNLAAWLILCVAILRVRTGNVEGVYLATLVVVALAAFEAVHPLAQAAQQVEESLHAARRLFAVGQIAVAVPDPPSPRPLPTKPDIEIHDLTFRYAPGRRAVLRDVDVELPMGKHLAIVGPSGAGKTTLVNLLLRLWDFEEGHILLDGCDVYNFSPDDVRGLFNVVAQNTYLFNASIYDNIRLADPGAERDEIIAATRRAQLHDFITSLPHGYDTVIGERGLQLSGGQRQRLAVARALVRPAPILLLDEATANLDADTEWSLLAGLFDWAAGRTVVLVSHRLLFMERFDEIVVLNEGKIVERGCHGALLRLNGLYTRLWRLQQAEPLVVSQRLAGVSVATSRAPALGAPRTSDLIPPSLT